MDLTVHQVPVASLTRDPNNARVHSPEQIKVLQGLLERFGQRVPIVVNRRTNVIEKGNGLHEAVEDLGWETIAVVYADDDEATATAFALADNRSGDLSWFDDEVVHGQLKFLLDEGFSVDMLGFDIDAIETVDSAAEKIPPAPTERADELQAKWKVERGQVWEMASKVSLGAIHRVMCGDACSADNVSKLLRDARPAFMMTDPPYGVDYDSAWREEVLGGQQTVGTIQNDDRVDWSEAWPLWDAPILYVWHAGVFAHVVAESLIRSGYEIRSQIVWVKQALVLSRGHYHWRHEPCWYAVRSGETASWHGDRKQTTVWEVANQGAVQRGDDELDAFDGGHVSQKPAELYIRAFRNHTVPRDLVADAFLGTGTAIAAAEAIGRTGVGMELDPRFVAVTLERLSEMGLEPHLVAE
jgi:DNA modification methylase